MGYILSDFFTNSSGGPQFSAIFDNFGEKIGFFSKTNVMIKILHNLAFVLSQKRQFFRRKYLKNHNIGPWSPSLIPRFFDNLHFTVFHGQTSWIAVNYVGNCTDYDFK
jgi:hypothetical protein